jgi:hypothetical protein
MLSKNFEIKDFYLVQWFTTEIKHRFKDLYLMKINQNTLEYRIHEGEDESENKMNVFDDLDDIDDEIRKYFGMEIN